MSAVPASLRIGSPWRVALPALLVLLLVIGVLYRDTAMAMVGIWSRSDTFAHAFMVPPISLWLIWRQRHALARLAPRPLPWMLVPDLPPDAAGDPCYRVEAFCSITAETPIDAPDAATFLDAAVRFANDTMWGTLNATVIVDPRTARDPAFRPALDRAIGDLRYGTVSLNHWSAAGYGIGITPWGAFPGNPRHDIGSGTGFVHNPLMFDAAEKTVIRGPFRAWPKPPWLSSHRGAHKLMPELTRFEADHHLRRLLPIARYAIRG